MGIEIWELLDLWEEIVSIQLGSPASGDQALAQAGYSDPNQWFLRYYNEPQVKIVDSSRPHFTQLPYDIQNNNAWGTR